MDELFKKRAQELAAQMTPEEKIAEMLYNAAPIARLGIPGYNWWNEALHGVARNGHATVFPQAIAMAASFDDALLQRIADAISDEGRAKFNAAREKGYTNIYEGITFWSPNINLFRDPRWGRGQETYGEDRYLTARMGTAFVKGLQGDHPIYKKADATLKHFAVHSGPEKRRHEFDASVSDKDLEDYLYAFRYIIEKAQPSAVMGAYNRVNGEAACASPTLLQAILRDRWGFDGYVVSDCGAISDIYKHHKLANSMAEAAALAVKAGCDLNCGSAYTALAEALDNGYLTEDDLTRSVERLLYARMKLGLFDDDCPFDDYDLELVECSAHRALSLTMAKESLVLLENRSILPLDPQKSLALIGPNLFDDSIYLGNYNGIPSEIITFEKGIRALSKGRVTLAKGCDKSNTLDPVLQEDALKAAKDADVILFFGGIDPSMEGEEGDAYNTDASGDRVTLDLPNAETELLTMLSALGKPIVFINVSGSCVNLRLPKERCQALVQCFYPGAEGGAALAEILFGKAAPSGRLPVTFYETLDDLPDFEDYRFENRTYRHYKGIPLYPFGYGLTYAEIVERDRTPDGVTLENRGSCEQSYVALAYDDTGALCDFVRVTLTSGEKRRVNFQKYR